ncbi:MAG: hypothetical protein Q9219_005786 [cf. Caloplaca sp. 3 TL-2023]
MPSVVLPQRRSRDSSFDDEVSQISATANLAAKKARLNLNGDATPSRDLALPNGHRTTSDEGSQQEILRSRRSKASHQPGSIVRVKLANFVTYTAVEFFPGPSLNMVIGPNGTGKSTLVCAICLGLGWGPQHLGRAKDVSEFVKHGEQEAHIEIELAADPKRHRRNPVIKCNIKRENNKSTFSIDDKPSSKKSVIELCRSFTIQIDNLCQFLPQDKVVEFAAMTPVELLRSTQRAVAPQEMLDMHDELKEHRQSQKTVQAKLRNDQDALENLENRQRAQAGDVERMREREVIKRRVEYLEMSRPFPLYRGALSKFKEGKRRRQQASEELKNLETEVEPSLRAVNLKQEYQKQVQAGTSAKKKVVQDAERAADAIDRKLKDLHDRKAEMEAEVEAEKNGGKESRKEIARLEQIITRLKKQIEEAPPDLDISGYNERMREKNRLVDDASQEITDLKLNQTELSKRGREKNERIRQARDELANLESQAGQQETKLKGASLDTFRAWDYVKKHQGDFEKQVFGPPIVECSVTDLRYVDQVEVLFQKNQLLTFTCQTKNDFKKLSAALHDHLHLAEINIQNMEGNLENFPAPVDRSQLSRYGLTGWALDYITGPEPVMAMLCANVRLNSTGVGDGDTTSEQFDLLQNGPIESWVTKKSSYKVLRRREYGPSATSTNVRDVRKAQVWTNQPIDMSAKHDLQENIEGWQSELVELKNQIDQNQQEIERLRTVIRENQEEHKNLQTEKAAKQKALAEIKALPTRLAQQEERLTAAKQSIAEMKQRLQAIQEKQEHLTRERAQAALDYAAAIEVLQTAHTSLYEAEIMLIEATSDVQTLVEKNASVKSLLAEKQAEVDELKQEVDECHRTAKEILQQVTAVTNQADEELLKFFKEELPPNQTVEELESEIESEKARLELMHEGGSSRGVIQEFEAREARIRKLREGLEALREEATEAEERVRSVRERWEPELDRLVGLISRSFGENMREIGCAGEVGVAKEEDFEDWSVRILVKFRESEPLTPLDSHRQSGGERAVSTIFYLMSLQSLTRSPFRVVDEINQGMDPRNERLVHRRMVGLACCQSSPPPAPTSLTASTPASNGAERSFDSVTVVNGDVNGDGVNLQASEEEAGPGGGSQYFLITPKLLPSLHYARGMRVLCIASGEHVPERNVGLDFRQCVDVRRKMEVGGTSLAVR